MVLAVGATAFSSAATAGAWNSVTSVGSFTHMPEHPSGIKLAKPLVFSKQTRGMGKRFGRYGQQSAEGNIAQDLFFEGQGQYYKTALALSTAAGTNFNTHTLTIPDATGIISLANGLVLYQHRDLATFQFLSAFCKKLSWAFSEDPFVAFSADIIAASRSRIGAITPSFGTLAPCNPFGNGTTTGLVIAATVNGNTFSAVYAKSASISLTNPIDIAKSITSQTGIKAMRTGQYEVSGTWTWMYSTNDSLSSDYLAAWENETLVTNLSFTLTGGTIAGSSPTTPYSIRWLFPSAYVKGSDPVVGSSGAIEQSFEWEAGVTNNATTSIMTLTLVNNETL